MTYPDYPDYSRLASQAASAYPPVSGLISANPSSGVLDSIGYGYIDLGISSIGASDIFAVTIDWYQDKAATIHLISDQIIPLANWFSDAQYPVVARYFKVRVSYFMGPATDTCNIFIYGSNSKHMISKSEQIGFPYYYSNTTIGAGVELRSSPLGPVECDAVFSVMDLANNKWYGAILFYDVNTFSYQYLTIFDGSTSNTGQWRQVSVALPPTPIIVATKNEDVAAQNIITSLVLIPR